MKKRRNIKKWNRLGKQNNLMKNACVTVFPTNNSSSLLNSVGGAKLLQILALHINTKG